MTPLLRMRSTTSLCAGALLVAVALVVAAGDAMRAWEAVQPVRAVLGQREGYRSRENGPSSTDQPGETMRRMAVQALVLTCMCGGAAAAHGQVVHTTSPPSPDNRVITFSDFPTGYGSAFTSGVQVGAPVGEDVVASVDGDGAMQPCNGFATSALGSVLNGEHWALPFNYYWHERHMAGLNCSAGSLTFTFASPVSFVGGFMNYATLVAWTDPFFIEALSPGGEVLASFSPVFATSGPNEGEFHGFRSTEANIGAFRLNNAYVAVGDLTFSRDVSSTVTPEPISMLLLGTGLSALGAVTRRRRSSVVETDA